jgi:hypothetical protein
MEPSPLQGRGVCELSPQGCVCEAHVSSTGGGCGGAPRLHFVFIVTSYGCNSTPSDMWVPHSKIFTKYDEAYAYFLKMSPPLNDKYNIAEQVVNDTYKEDDRTKDFVIIENRVELAGYHCGGSGYYAKRPKGAVIARSIVQ